MNTDEELIETSDGAFISASSPNRLKQIELYPFSLMRQATALSLGLDNAQDGFWNAIVMVWLCTLDEDGCIWAKENKKEAIKEAFAWGDSEGYSLANFEPILRIYTKINTEIRRSTDAVLSTNGTQEKNFGGQPAS
jgi:hypothetical protein